MYSISLLHDVEKAAISQLKRQQRSHRPEEVKECTKGMAARPSRLVRSSEPSFNFISQQTSA
jgi:hypothetical protein